MSCNSPGIPTMDGASVLGGGVTSGSQVVAKANSLEESIIRSLNEKYKDFRVEDNDYDDVIDVGDNTKRVSWPTPRRSQSWLCCPTIYKTSANNTKAGHEQNAMDGKDMFKDDSNGFQSTTTTAPKPNPHNVIPPPVPPHHQLHTQTMRSEVVELSQRLQRSEHSRHVLEQQLRDTLQDRERTHRQLESLAATHESRITEMHCVIVELSKKLKTKEDGAIAEEPEGSGEFELQLLFTTKKSKEAMNRKQTKATLI